MKQHLLGRLLEEKEMKLKGGLYHQTQIQFAYNSNRIEGSRLSEDQTRYIYETNTVNMEQDEAASVASHGYSHLDARAVSYQSLEKDTVRWKNEVGSLIGPTNIYVYPFGSSALPGDPKFQFLLDQGFNILCSVGPTPYLKDLPIML